MNMAAAVVAKLMTKGQESMTPSLAWERWVIPARLQYAEYAALPIGARLI